MLTPWPLVAALPIVTAPVPDLMIPLAPRVRTRLVPVACTRTVPVEVKRIPAKVRFAPGSIVWAVLRAETLKTATSPAAGTAPVAAGATLVGDQLPPVPQAAVAEPRSQNTSAPWTTVNAAKLASVITLDTVRGKLRKMLEINGFWRFGFMVLAETYGRGQSAGLVKWLQCTHCKRQTCHFEPRRQEKNPNKISNDP